MKKNILNILLVYILVFISGSVLYQVSSEKYLVIAFLFVLLSWLIFSDRKLNDKFLVYTSIFAGFLLGISLYTGGSLGLVSVISTTMKLVLAYLVLKTVGDEFIETFVNVIVFLAAFSIFGYLVDTFLLFDGVIRKLPIVGDNGYEGLLFVYRRYYAGWGRNASIFFEPGAYQGFLNAAIFLLLFAKHRFSIFRRWASVVVLFVTLLTTTSTTGYLIFAVMFGVFLLKDKTIQFSTKAAIIGMIPVLLIVFSSQLYSLIIDKIVHDILSVEELTDKTHRRGFDAVVDLEIFKRHMLGTGYNRYREEFSSIGLVSWESAGRSSNGITKTLAIYGLPFTLFLFGSYYWAFRRLLRDSLMSAMTFALLMAYFLGEAYYVLTPFCLTIIAAAFLYNPSAKLDRISSDAKPISDA